VFKLGVGNDLGIL